MGVKISELPTFSSPLTGNELVAIVQDSITRQAPISAYAAPLTGVGGMLARTELSSLSGGWDATRINVAAKCTSWDASAAWCTTYGNAVVNCVESNTTQGQAKVTTVGGTTSTVNIKDIQTTSTPTFASIAIDSTVRSGCINAGYCTTVAAGNSYSSIVGGYYGCACGVGSFVGGGNNNKTTGTYSAVVNGCYNTVDGNNSAILTGTSNTISCAVSGASILSGTGISAACNDTAYTQKLNISEVPTACAGLPVGSIYRTGNDLKIVI